MAKLNKVDQGCNLKKGNLKFEQIRQTSEVSSSAVSKPIFASKYSPTPPCEHAPPKPREVRRANDSAPRKGQNNPSQEDVGSVRQPGLGERDAKSSKKTGFGRARGVSIPIGARGVETWNFLASAGICREMSSELKIGSK